LYGEDAIQDDLSVEDTSYETDLKGLLQSYLENAALYSDGDNENTSEEFVRLLTIHSAKGLEFGVVFLVGTEEGIFPGARSIESNEGLEEERRLAYVAITRAKKKLFITSARSRILFGQTSHFRSRVS
jgi:DNA helicase-2/ATP-dependent DNA helicase PcrA